ncbi:MAG: hypothetical protein IT203_09125 [Fimbriimonadaceae bacterium]|nr:hypothetical protein [Fimbriimonadaceae bacterium]
MPPPLTDPVLIALASKVGLEEAAKSWIANPSQQALSAIADDQSTTLELKIQTLPALAELSPPGESGQRTLRLVPLSAIGV